MGERGNSGERGRKVLKYCGVNHSTVLAQGTVEWLTHSISIKGLFGGQGSSLGIVRFFSGEENLWARRAAVSSARCGVRTVWWGSPLWRNEAHLRFDEEAQGQGAGQPEGRGRRLTTWLGPK